MMFTPEEPQLHAAGALPLMLGSENELTEYVGFAAVPPTSAVVAPWMVRPSTLRYDTGLP